MTGLEKFIKIIKVEKTSVSLTEKNINLFRKKWMTIIRNLHAKFK